MHPNRGSFLTALAFVEGAAVMMTQLAAAKMLAPIHGGSLYVWGSIVGMTLVSLTAGYYLGGLLSLRRSRRNTVLWFMFTAAMLIALMPEIARLLLPASVALDTIPAILLLTTLLLTPALVLLGATSPLIVSLLAERIEDAGRAAGTVYGVSTVGGILGTFAAGFFLIPIWGLNLTAITAAALLAALPLAALLARRHYSSAAMALAVIVALTLRPEPGTHPDATVLYQSEGLLGQVKVIDFSYPQANRAGTRTDRILFVNGTAQTWIVRDTGEPVWDYVRHVQSVASLLPEGSRVLLLGLGGGTVALYLKEIGLIVDGVELDARIARIARDYFGLGDSDEVFVDDASHYLRTTDRRYDLILFDVFQAEVPPAHLLTLETFQRLHERLSPEGFFIVNYSGYLSGSTGRGARSIYRTLLEASEQVAVVPTSKDEHARNNLFIASRKPLDFSTPRMPLVVHGQAYRLTDLVLDPEAIVLDDAIVLRENRPVLEKLNLEAAARWRRASYDYFTAPLIEKGMPIFD